MTRYIKSSTGGQFAFMPNGWAIREIAGAWFLFNQDDVVQGRFDTRDAAEEAWALA